MKTGRLSAPAASSKRYASISMDWLDGRNWRLPSGKALAEFFLQAGFLAPFLLKAEEMKMPLRSASATRLSGLAGQGRLRRPVVKAPEAVVNTAPAADRKPDPVREFR